jgi:hypothetical protein
MGTMVEYGGRVSISYFSTIADERSGAPRLFAAVAWRKAESFIQRKPLPRWRQLWALFRGRNSPAQSRWKAPDGWAGSAGENGENEVLFHSRKGVVRVLGRQFQLPTDGRTLILLVDEDGLPPGAEPEFTVYSIENPVVPHPLYKPSLDKSFILERFNDSHREAGRAWHSALHNDPVVSAFLGRSD